MLTNPYTFALQSSNIATQICDFLRKLHETLLALESSTSTLDEVLPAMDYILKLFETKKVEFEGDSILGPCINSGWSKLVKYYDKTSESPAYVAALVLNPAFKWEYIEKTWDPTWIQGARESVVSLWKSKYRPNTTHFAQIDTPSKTTRNHFNQWKEGKHASRHIPTHDSKNFLTLVQSINTKRR